MRVRGALCAAVLLILIGGRVATARADGDSSSNASCHWEAPATLEVRDGSVVPTFAYPRWDSGTPSTTLPTAVLNWNPVFPIDARGRIHGNSLGYVSSIVTVTGGPCTQAMTEVLVYSDGFQPQRSLSVGYGGSKVADEYDPGSVDWQTFVANAELESAFGLRSALLAVDARSFGYAHPANSALPLACPVTDDPGCVTTLAGSQTYRTGFRVRDDSIETRFGWELLTRGPTIDAAYTADWSNGGRGMLSGFGIGLEVPPNLNDFLSAYGAVTYYPTLSGGGAHYTDLRARIGATVSLYGWLSWPGFVDASFVDERRIAAPSQPASAQLQALTLSFGRRF